MLHKLLHPATLLFATMLLISCGDDNDSNQLDDSGNILGKTCDPLTYQANCTGMNARSCKEYVVDNHKSHHVRDIVCSDSKFAVNNVKAGCYTFDNDADCLVKCSKEDEEITWNDTAYHCVPVSTQQGDLLLYMPH